MNAPPPIAFFWDGESMTPKLPKLADRHYVIGESYLLEPHEERSQRSHAHYFACLHEAWMNLPEIEAFRFPTSEHLRKWALIETGFRNEHKVVASDDQQAAQIAAVVKHLDNFAVVQIVGPVVAVYTAKSQATRGPNKMPAAEFKASKQAVLDKVSALIGVSVTDLETKAKVAA